MNRLARVAMVPVLLLFLAFVLVVLGCIFAREIFKILRKE